VLFASMALMGFTIAPLAALKPCAFVVAYLTFAGYKLRRPGSDPRVIHIFAATGQILLIPVLATPLTYVAAAANLPMQDAALDAIDRALGLDWMAWFNFFAERHSLLFATVLGYSMIGWPIIGIPIALGWTQRYLRLQQFTLAFLIALAITTAISIFTPAMGTYDYFRFMPQPDVFTPGAYLGQLRDLPAVRDGTLRHLSLDILSGIVTFPSFHAAAAVLYLWALWPVRWIGSFAAVTNVAMLIATPICGGHYFIDVAGGIAVAVTAILVAKWLTAWLTRPAAVAQPYDVQTGVPAR
jgi:membrane-associated phospholipid phosphatase